MSQADSVSSLAAKHCKACKPGTPAATPKRVKEILGGLKGWASRDNKEMAKTYPFKNYYETMAFVNAVAWISHQEDHHPDLEVGYNKCRVRYSTHAIGGLSENDFICAAKVEKLLRV
jgi:4a-hydroxytetrahydrobiopterin dehydratase